MKAKSNPLQNPTN